MEEAGDRVVVCDVAERALPVSEMKVSDAELMTVIAAEGRDVKRMNQPANRSITLLLELRAGDRNNFGPLLAPIRNIILGHQDVCHHQSTTHVRRKCRRSGIARLHS